MDNGWTALNTDGCFNERKKHAGAGGSLRDHDRNWLGGFSIKLGYCTGNEAELWGLLYVIRVAWEKDHRLVSAELYSSNIFQWVIDWSEVGRKHTNLIQECRDLLHSNTDLGE